MSDDTRSEVLEQFEEIKYIGPAYAEQLYDDLGLRSFEEVVEAARDDRILDISGIGPSKRDGILESAESLVEAQSEGDDRAGEETRETETESSEPSEHEPTGEGEVEVRSVGREPRTSDEAEIERETVERASDTVDEAVTSAEQAAESATEEMETAVSDESDDETPDTSEETSRPRPRIDRFIERLRCPACGHDTFERTQSTLSCHACRRDYDMEEGVVDLAPPKMQTGGLAQRIMESNLYARFYENVMRPNLTKLVSNRTMKEERELAAEYLELDADSTLLDVATGTGNFIRHFAKEIAGEASGYDDRSLAVGMDISWPMLEQAQSLLRREGLTDRIFLLRGDATRIPLGRETFSRVHCAGGLHLMGGSIDEALRNFSRVLEEDGILVVSTFLIEGPLVKQFAKRIAGLASHFHWFDRDELRDRLQRAGLEVEQESVSQEAITVKARRS